MSVCLSLLISYQGIMEANEALKHLFLMQTFKRLINTRFTRQDYKTVRGFSKTHTPGRAHKIIFRAIMMIRASLGLSE